MQSICARLRRDIDSGAPRDPLFCIERVSDHIDGIYGLERRTVHWLIRRIVVGGTSSVYASGVGINTRTVDGITYGAHRIRAI